MAKKHQTFRLGDTVRIISGPFVSFTGKIQGINQSKALLLVKVAIYGRTKPIRLNFADVEVMSGFVSFISRNLGCPTLRHV